MAGGSASDLRRFSALYLPFAPTVANRSEVLGGLGTDRNNPAGLLRPHFPPKGLGISGLYRVRRPGGRFASRKALRGLNPYTRFRGPLLCH